MCLCVCLDSIQYVDSSFNLHNSSVFTILSKCLAISLLLAIVFALYAPLLLFRAASKHFYYLMMWQSCLEKMLITSSRAHGDNFKLQ